MKISPWAKFGTSVVLNTMTTATASSAYTLPVTSPDSTLLQEQPDIGKTHDGLRRPARCCAIARALPV